MRESDIRPRVLFDRYLELSRRDIERSFSDKSRYVSVVCPACGSNRQKLAFEKLGFLYQSCVECETLYVSPRPTFQLFADYYRDSESVKFWSKHFYKETAEARREKLFKPRAQLVADLVKQYLSVQTDTFVDVGSGYGLFLEEVAGLGVFGKVVGIEPAPDLAQVCRGKGFDVIQYPVESIECNVLQASMVTAFEVLEHVFDPAEFLTACARILHNDGLLLFTTLTISGFDLQVLWDQSKSIYPPHHINFISVEGMQALVERCNLDIIELGTPGTLDVDIVLNALKENPAIPFPRFVSYLSRQRSDSVHQAFQVFLQQSKLSSHIRCIVRKPSRETGGRQSQRRWTCEIEGKR